MSGVEVLEVSSPQVYAGGTAILTEQLDPHTECPLPNETIQQYSRFIKVSQAGSAKSGALRCESCGISIGITGGYLVIELNGVYHSLFCLEQGIFYRDDPKRKGSKGARVGKGELLRLFIAALAKREAAQANGQVCKHCGGTLIACRTGAKYCCSSCRQMAHAKSKKAKNDSKKPHKTGCYPSILSSNSMLGHPDSEMSTQL